MESHLMRKGCAVAVSALTVGALIGFGGGPADAGNFAKVKIAKHADGPYKFGSVNTNLEVNEKRFVYIKAKSQTGPQAAKFQEFEPAPGADYVVKYFRGQTNITDAVQGSGYNFTLPSTYTRFRVRVKAVNPPDPDCVTVVVQIGMQANLVTARLNGGSCPA